MEQRSRHEIIENIKYKEESGERRGDEKFLEDFKVGGWWSLMGELWQLADSARGFELSWNLRYSSTHYPFTAVFYRSIAGLERVTRISPTYDTPRFTDRSVSNIPTSLFLALRPDFTSCSTNLQPFPQSRKKKRRKKRKKKKEEENLL